MAYATVALTGTYQFPDGSPAVGTIEIIPSERMILDDEGNVVISGRSKVRLDEQGSFSVALPATDDPALTPTGFGYTVAARLHHTHLAAVSFQLPAAVPVVDITDVTQVDPSTFAPDANYVTDADLSELDTRVTALETTPAVTSYLELTDKPVIPSTATDVGAEPAGLSAETDAALSVTYAARQAALAPQVAPAMKPDWITTFPAGHGWVADGTRTTFEDVTTDPALGSQAVRIVNGTASASTGIGKTGLTAVDASDKVFVAWIKSPDVSRLASIHLLAGDGNFTNYFTLRTWLSGAADKPTTNNRWTPIYFTFNAGAIGSSGAPNRASITAIKLRFFAHTNATATDPLDVTVGGIGVVDDASALYPNGVVTFTFDDGYDDQFTEGKAYLDKYGFPATLYIVQEAVGQANRLTLAELKRLRDHSGWEIAGHAYTEHAHTDRLTSLTDDELEVEMANLKGWLLDNGFNSDNYCYPGGVFTDREIAAVGRYFSTARTTSTQPTHTLVPPPDPLMITQYDPASGGASALANAKAMVDTVKADKTWVQLMIHIIGTGGISQADFRGLVDYCAEQGVAVRTVQQVMRAASVEPPPIVASGGSGEPSTSNVQTAYKPSDTTRNNTATRTADPHLTLPVEANSTYLVEGFLAYASSTTADLNVRWEGPAGQFPTMRWSPAALIGPATSSTSSVNKSTYSNLPLSLGADGSTGGVEARPMGYVSIGSTGGDFSLTWAQNVAEASDTTLLAGSWLRLTKVA